MIYLAHRLLTPFTQIRKRGNSAWPDRSDRFGRW